MFGSKHKQQTMILVAAVAALLTVWSTMDSF